MCSKKFLFFVLIASVSSKKSFTIVLDTTISMREEIDIIKANIRSVLNNLGNATEYKNYIIVPFGDPDVGTPVISSTPAGLIDNLNIIRTSGGVDCPENSVAGIAKALQISEPQSTILVFTDGYAKEYSNLNSIVDLCRQKFSQVMIFLSGVCLPTSTTQEGDLGVYYDVTRACSGSVIRFGLASQLRQASRFIREMKRIEWNDINAYESFSSETNITFRVDSLTTDLMLVLSGDRPQFQIIDQNGYHPKMEWIIDTRYSQVIRLQSLETGNYIANVVCQGTTTATLYKNIEIPYVYGFSTIPAKSIMETSRRPMPGRMNYILINVLKSSVECKKIEIFDGVSKKEVNVERTDKPNLYLANTFIDPDRIIRITAQVEDSNYEVIFSKTNPVEPQKAENQTSWSKPTSMIIEPDEKLVNFGGNVTLACKVTAFPRPNVQWKDDAGNVMPSNEVLLEIPSTYISYATLENVKANTTVYCKSENPMSDATDSLDVFVNRTFSFDVIQTPIEQTVEYGSEGKLFCQVDAYPEATIKWYHNDSLVESSDHLQLAPRDFALYINNMSLEDAGIYTCAAENVANRRNFSALVYISGIEVPEVAKKTQEIVLKPGDWTDLECGIVKGKPAPQITWSYKLEDEYDSSLPEGVFVEDGKLKIPSVQREHKGVYRCTASNLLGEDFTEITINIRFSPIIKSNEVDNLTVREGDLVELPCEVTASPKATVRWEMSQDDMIIPLDGRHLTDASNTHRFNALGKDSGNYHCIAENNIGRTEITVKLNVLVTPYIEPAKHRHISVGIGSNVTLACNVLFGNPAPSIKWEFLSRDFISSPLKRANSNILQLNNISRHNEGTYLCIAENEIGSDIIKYYIKIQ